MSRQATPRTEEIDRRTLSGYLMVAVGLGLIAFAVFFFMNIAVAGPVALLYAVPLMIVGTFVLANAVSWPHTLVMIVTATVGGYWGAAVARKLPAIWLRRFIIGVGGVLTIYYFGKTL